MFAPVAVTLQPLKSEIFHFFGHKRDLGMDHICCVLINNSRIAWTIEVVFVIFAFLDYHIIFQNSVDLSEIADETYPN